MTRIGKHIVSILFLSVCIMLIGAIARAHLTFWQYLGIAFVVTLYASANDWWCRTRLFKPKSSKPSLEELYRRS